MTVNTTSVRPDLVEGQVPDRKADGLRQVQSERTVRVARANWLAFLLPAALLAGAWGSQLIGGLSPCEMCHWQRWPHYGAAAAAVLASGVGGRARIALIVFAALLLATSGVIGVMHAGVEYGWWPGFTACSSPVPLTGATAAERLEALFNAPVVRCDTPQWTLAGISLAGYNAIFSLGGALAILWLLRRAR